MPGTYDAPALYIGGEWLEGGKGPPIVNPATEEELGHLPLASTADLDRALDSAARGFAVWRAKSPEARGEILHEWARLVRERADRIAEILTLEQGKIFSEARGEVVRSAALIEWDADEGRRAYGHIIPGDPALRLMTLRQPIGPVAAFTPWNFPASSPARKVSAALAAGCSIIVKAAEETPGTATAIVRCLVDAGVPPGVVNLVFGKPAEISAYLIASPIIRAATFTGSVPVGKHLAGLAAAQMKPVIMELGGHSPVIVCDDVDAAAAGRLAIAAKIRNAGQVCTSPTRFIVQEKIHDAFVDSFVAGAKAVRVGNGMDKGVQMGPLANPRRIEAMDRLIADAARRGATLAAGGGRIGNRGYFFEPTIVTGLPLDSEMMNVEPFGPLAPVTPFRDLEDAIALANALPYGLASYAFTNSPARAAALTDQVESGIMSINHFGTTFPSTPFGGVKESGYGREGGDESLDGFMVTKFVSHRAEMEVG